MLNLSRPTRSLTFGAVLLFATGLRAAVPDWIRTAAAEPLPTYDAETNAVVLLDEVTDTVTGPGAYVEHYRRIIKILRPEGRKEAEFAVYLDSHEKSHFIHCWSIDRSGKEYELKDNDFMERGVVFGFELYNDLRLRTATCPAADPGSVVALEYEVERRPFVAELVFGFQETIPIRLARIVLKLPVGWEYKTLWGNGVPVQPVKSADGGWEWTLHDLAAIEHEPMRPSTWALSTRLGLAYFSTGPSAENAGSWAALGRWYTQLTADRRRPTPELAEKVRQLTAGKSDFDGKARSLASFLQSEVRYVAIEIGIGGYQPHPAADIFRARYGDCKDKATLLSSMLHEVGIDSEYLLISTYRGTVDPALPSPHFNHVILAIEVPRTADPEHYQAVVTGKSGKHYLIFDPTDPYTPLGDLRGDLQDSDALLVADGGGEIIHTPLARPETNLLSRIGHFTLSTDGTLAGNIVESRSGDHAWRERASLMHANQQERSQQLERRLNRSLKGFTVQSSDIQQLDQLQQNLVLTFKFSTPAYAQVRDPLMLVRARVMGEKSIPLERKPRHFPFQFEATSRETDMYEIDLPEEYVVDDVPDPVKVDMGFAMYQSKVEVVGSKLRYSREFVQRNVLIPPDRTEDLRKLEGIIGADEVAAVVLKRAQ
jgi:transglutaminase-like putative cysteine protease